MKAEKYRAKTPVPGTRDRIEALEILKKLGRYTGAQAVGYQVPLALLNFADPLIPCRSLQTLPGKPALVEINEHVSQ